MQVVPLLSHCNRLFITVILESTVSGGIHFNELHMILLSEKNFVP